MDLFCSNCGNPLREGVKFCNKCGSKVNIEDTPSDNQEADAYITPQLSDSNKIQNEESKSANNTFQEQTIQPNLNTSNNIKLQPSPTVNNNQNNEYQTPKNGTFSFGKIIKNWWNGKFEGRCSRLEWWFTFLILLLLISFSLGIVPVIGQILFRGRTSDNIYYEEIISYTWGIILFLVTLFPNLRLIARRFHDLNMSGWWQIIFFMPFIIGLILIIIYEFFKPSSIIGSFYYIARSKPFLYISLGISGFVSFIFSLYFAFAPGTKGPNRYGQPNNSNYLLESNLNPAIQNNNNNQQNNNFNYQNNVAQISNNKFSDFIEYLKKWCNKKFDNIRSKFDNWKKYLEEKENTYSKACELIRGNLEDCHKAKELFLTIKYYEDSESKIKECEKRIEALEKEELKKKELAKSKNTNALESEKQNPIKEEENEIEFNKAEQEIQTETESEEEKEVETKQEAQPEIEEYREEEESQDSEEEIVYGSKDIIVRGSKTRNILILCFVVFYLVYLFLY